jgi:hypothetical protein
MDSTRRRRGARAWIGESAASLGQLRGESTLMLYMTCRSRTVGDRMHHALVCAVSRRVQSMGSIADARAARDMLFAEIVSPARITSSGERSISAMLHRVK